MKEIKLISLLQTFSPEEIKQFRKFAASPYFNEGRNSVPLINEVLKYYPGFNEPEFTKENIFGALYPGIKFNLTSIDKQFSRAAALADKFLLQKGLEKDGDRMLAVHAKELSKRNLNKLFESKIKEAEALIALNSPYDTHYFEAIRDLEVIKVDNLLGNRDPYSNKDKFFARGDYNLLDMMFKFILSIQDIALVCYEMNMDLEKSLAYKAAEFIDIEGIIRMLKGSGNRYSGVLELKYRELNALMKPGIKNYLTYKEVFKENLPGMGWSAKFNSFIIVSSICIISRQHDAKFFNTELYELNKFKVDENSYAFSEELYTYLPLYVSLLSSFINNRDTEYLDKLIGGFGSRIDPAHKESFISYSFMQKMFLEKRFDEALRYHSMVNYDHNLIRINARILLIQLYYEIGYTEELFSLLDAVKKYFTTKKNYSRHKIDVILRFLKIVKKLSKIRSAGTGDTEDLKNELNSEAEIQGKVWLREKITELEAVTG
jgi:hypothetical protein